MPWLFERFAVRVRVPGAVPLSLVQTYNTVVELPTATPQYGVVVAKQHGYLQRLGPEIGHTDNIRLQWRSFFLFFLPT